MANKKDAIESTETTTKSPIDRMNEKVMIKLFKDSGKYKDDLVVTVNGVAYQIQRGKTVEVPRFVADIIAQSEKQDSQTANLIDDLTENFKNETKKYGVTN